MDLEAWARGFKDPDQRIIEQTELPDGRLVSTVWLGLDHSFGGGPPMIFETMVFPKRGDYSELDCERWATEEEARAGHRRLVEKWSDDPDPPPPAGDVA